MLRLIWNLSVGLRNALHRFAPTNILSDAIRTRRRGLKWGVPAMLLAGPYLYLAYICTVLIDEGGPAWLSLLVLLFIWNAMKMLWIGPVSLVVLIRVRVAEANQRLILRRSARGDQKGTNPMQTMRPMTCKEAV